jgi:predicted enzyme related to lactoylglutathione lyase
VITPSSLSRSPVYPVLRAEDLGRARRFYEDLLGLEAHEVPDRPTELRVAAGAHTLVCLYERPGMQTPENTVACFEVTDIDGVVKELRGRGVAFEEYDMPEMGLVTVGSVAQMGSERRAWLKDSEGNAIVLRQG